MPRIKQNVRAHITIPTNGRDALHGTLYLQGLDPTNADDLVSIIDQLTAALIRGDGFEPEPEPEAKIRPKKKRVPR